MLLKGKITKYSQKKGKKATTTELSVEFLKEDNPELFLSEDPIEHARFVIKTKQNFAVPGYNKKGENPPFFIELKQLFDVPDETDIKEFAKSKGVEVAA